MASDLPARWDLEADLVCVGSGGGGLAAAITAHDNGATAVVLEQADQVGGVTAYSMGEVWVPGNHLARELGIDDTEESGFRYVRALSMDHGDDGAMLNQAVHAPVALRFFEDRIGLRMRVIRDCPDYYYPLSNDSVAEGRLLEALPFSGASLGEWQWRTRVSPQVPYGMTHEDIFHGGGVANMSKWDFGVMAARLEKDERCLGPGFVAYFVKGVLDRGIAMHTGTRVESLLADKGRVVGVRAVQEGRELHVRARRGVVLAVSSYERNPAFAKTLGQQLDLGSMVMPGIDGSAFRLAGPLGARIAQVPDVTGLGFHIPGEEQEGEDPLWRGAIPFLGLPHTITVNRAGRRFADESFYRAIYYATTAIDGATQTYPNFPCWLVSDSQARAKYPFGSIMPGDELPQEVGVTAGSLRELAAMTGIDPEGLEATVARFNVHAANGTDPEFQRGRYPWSNLMTGDPLHKPNPNLGPLSEPPFYAIQLKRLGGGGIASTGLLADHHCRVLGWDDRPIEGLYAAGNSTARTDNGAMMQSGITNARGMTQGYLAGLHAAGRPSDLLPAAAARLGFEVAG
jgi:3-oxosteroid 1-dehydrogenase